MSQESFITYIKEITDIKILSSIQDELSKHIKALKIDQEINDIKENVLNNGYHIDTKEYKIDGINILPLKYYVIVYGYDKEDLSDAKISRSDDQQDPWTEELGFDYYAAENDSFEELVGDVDYGDWDDPYKSRAYIIMYLYFAKQKVPINKKFKTITEDGEIEELIFDGKKLTNMKTSKNEFFGSQELDIFVIPEDPDE